MLRISFIKKNKNKNCLNSLNIYTTYQNGSEMCKCYQVLVQDLDENVDENLAWLTQKTKDLKM